MILFGCQSMLASHVVGGDISYTVDSNGTYTVTYTMYRDCAPGSSGFNSSYTGKLRNAQTNSTLINFTFYGGPIVNVPPSGDTSCTVPASFCVQKRVYTGTFTYSGTLPANTYFTVTSGNRNASISNLINPTSTNAYYLTWNWPGSLGVVNSTPVFTNLPPNVVARNNTINIPFPAYDADGDSLYYELADAYQGYTQLVNYVSGYSGAAPFPVTTGFTTTINPTTGTVSSNISAIGQYVIAFKLTEFRNGIPLTTTLRDYQLNVTNKAPFSLAQGSISAVSCFGGNDGSAEVLITTGVPPFSFQWSNGASTQTLYGLAAGSLQVKVTDSLGCQDSLIVTIPQPTKLIFNSVVSTKASCLSAANASLVATASGGSPPYSFQLDSGPIQFTGSFNGVTPGPHTVYIFDANGCGIDTTIDIEADTIWHSYAIASITNPSCYGFSDGSILLNGQGHNVLWNTGDTTNLISNVPAGNYQAYILGPGGCTDTLSIELLNPTSLVIQNIAITPSDCYASASGVISITANGGVPPYEYQVNNSPLQYSSTFSGLTSGTYLISVWDSSGICSLDTTVTVPFDSTWNTVQVASVTNVACHGDSSGAIQLSGALGLNVLWLDNGSTSALRTGLVAGTYQAVISNSNGCSDTLTTVITEPVALSFQSVVGTGSSCLSAQDASLQVVFSGGTGPWTYMLNGTVSTTLNWPTLSAGSYTVSIVDANSCSIDTLVVLPADTLWHDYAVQFTANPSCNGLANGSISVVGTTGQSVLWNTGATTTTLTNLVAGTYAMYIYGNGGCADTIEVTLTEPPALTVQNVSVTMANCATSADGSVSIAIQGGRPPYTYQLNTQPSQTNGLFSSLATGVYTITVMDSLGICSLDTTVTVPFDSAWNTVQVASVTNVACHGDSSGAIQLSGALGLNVLWLDNGSTSALRTGLVAGTYQAVISNSNGCSDTLTTVITEPVALSGNLISNPEVCSGDGTSYVQAGAIGGTPPYSVIWSGMGSGNLWTIQNAASGTYSVVIEDANGCSWTKSIFLQNPSPLEISYTVVEPTSCGKVDGSIDLGVSGGVPPYVFTINNQLASWYTPVSDGQYSLHVIDANGCEWNKNLDVKSENLLTLYIPDAFTPNGDAVNERFEIFGNEECFTDEHFYITDRWGKVVFETEQPFVEFWDGRNDSQQIIPNAVYNYRFFSLEKEVVGRVIVFE